MGLNFVYKMYSETLTWGQDMLSSLYPKKFLPICEDSHIGSNCRTLLAEQRIYNQQQVPYIMHSVTEQSQKSHVQK